MCCLHHHRSQISVSCFCDLLLWRIPPGDWTPKGKEGVEAVLAILDLLSEMIHSGSPQYNQAAAKIAIDNSYNLLVRGYLEKLRAILDPKVLTEETRAQVVGSIEHFLYLQADYAPSHIQLSPADLEKIRAWKESLELSDLRGRMLTALGTNDWGFSGARREQWLAEISNLAKAFFENPETFRSQFDWLFSDNARSAGVLGEQIGLLDANGQLLDEVLQSVVRYHNSGFARGYIFGFLSHKHTDLKKLNQLLDQMQEADAQLGYELFIVGGGRTHACERTLALVRAGRLSVRQFRNLGFGAGGNLLTAENVIDIVDLLLEKIEAGDVEASETAIDVIAYNCLERSSGTPVSLDQDEIRAEAWKVVEKTAPHAGRETHWWAKIIEWLARYDLSRAAKVAADGLVGEGLNQREDAGKLLGTIAESDPAIAMEAVGTVIMDEKRGWRFFVGRYDLIKQLPTYTVIAWIDKHGVESARRIARQLPAPYLSQHGTPVVPPITEYVLKKFGQDKRVFNEFVAGVHNLQSYMGDIAGQKQQEADVARKFLDYPLRRIREWAQIEIMDAESQARFWQEWEAERKIE
jgi:hypothetical protein